MSGLPVTDAPLAVQDVTVRLGGEVILSCVTLDVRRGSSWR